LCILHFVGRKVIQAKYIWGQNTNPAWESRAPHSVYRNSRCGCSKYSTVFCSCDAYVKTCRQWWRKVIILQNRIWIWRSVYC